MTRGRDRTCKNSAGISLYTLFHQPTSKTINFTTFFQMSCQKALPISSEHGEDTLACFIRMRHTVCDNHSNRSVATSVVGWFLSRFGYLRKLGENELFFEVRAKKRKTHTAAIKTTPIFFSNIHSARKSDDPPTVSYS